MFELDINLIKALIFLSFLILADIILGISISLKNNEFNIEKLPNFLKTEVLPYYLSILSLSFLSMIEDVQGLGFQAITWTAIVAYGSKVIFVEIKNKISLLFNIDV